MATYQVRIDADGQKILSEPLSGLEGGIATEESPGVVQPDGKTVRVDNTGVLSALGGNLLLNDEIWITESGEWTAPVTGWYEVLLIGGGEGGLGTYYNPNYYTFGGMSGFRKMFFIYLQSGEIVSVAVGSGGMPGTSNSENRAGGSTSFGSIHAYGGDTTVSHTVGDGYAFCSGTWRDPSMLMPAPGAGPGGGYIDGGGSGDIFAAYFYGGGGAGKGEGASTAGYQGAIRLRFWNPAKANGPLE